MGAKAQRAHPKTHGLSLPRFVRPTLFSNAKNERKGKPSGLPFLCTGAWCSRRSRAGESGFVNQEILHPPGVGKREACALEHLAPLEEDTVSLFCPPRSLRIDLLEQLLKRFP